MGRQIGLFGGLFSPFFSPKSPIFHRSRLRRSRVSQDSFWSGGAPKIRCSFPCDWRYLSFCDVMRLLSAKLNFPHEQTLSSVSKIASNGMQCLSKHGCIIATVMYSINYYSSRRNVRCPRDIVYRISCFLYMHVWGRLVDFCGRYHPHPFLRKMKGRTLLKMCAWMVFGAFSGVFGPKNTQNPKFSSLGVFCLWITAHKFQVPFPRIIFTRFHVKHCSWPCICNGLLTEPQAKFEDYRACPGFSHALFHSQYPRLGLIETMQYRSITSRVYCQCRCLCVNRCLRVNFR